MKLAGRSKARKKLIFCRRGSEYPHTRQNLICLAKKKNTIHFCASSRKFVLRFENCGHLCNMENVHVHYITKKLLQYRHAKAQPAGQPDGEAGLLSP